MHNATPCQCACLLLSLLTLSTQASQNSISGSITLPLNSMTSFYDSGEQDFNPSDNSVCYQQCKPYMHSPVTLEYRISSVSQQSATASLFNSQIPLYPEGIKNQSYFFTSDISQKPLAFDRVIAKINKKVALRNTISMMILLKHPAYNEHKAFNCVMSTDKASVYPLG